MIGREELRGGGGGGPVGEDVNGIKKHMFFDLLQLLTKFLY